MSFFAQAADPIQRSSLRFATDLPIWQVALLAVVAAIAVCWLYGRQVAHLESRARYMLPALRAAAVVLVILLLSQPVWHQTKTIGTLGRIVFAIDSSGSMTLDESNGSGVQPPRWRRVVDLLQGTGRPQSSLDGPDAKRDQTSDDGWIGELSRSHEIDVVTFDANDVNLVWSSQQDIRDDDTESLATLVLPQMKGRTALENSLLPMLSIRATGTETDLSTRPEPTTDDLSNKKNNAGPTGLRLRPITNQRAAVVVFSDGRDTSVGSPRDVASQLNASQINVFTVGVGTTGEPDDIGVINVDCPSTVAADGQLSGRITIKTVAPRGTTIDVELRSKTPRNPSGQRVWHERITAKGDVTETIAFQIPVETIQQLQQVNADGSPSQDSVVIEMIAAVTTDIVQDGIPQNDSVDFRVAATNRDLRLLILDGSSRWENRYVRNLFDRDPAWEVTSLLFGNGTDRPEIARGEDELGRPGLPVRRDDWSRFDAVILGEIPPDQWTQEDSYRLKEYVTRGGGLIVMDGRLQRIARLTQADLRDLVPVRFSSSMMLLPSTRDVDARRLLKPMVRGLSQVVPTVTAREMPLFNIATNQSDSQNLWTQIPAMSSLVPVTPAADAEVWAEAIDATGDPHPWMVTKLFGGGRVVYLASDQTWRWRYKVADRFHARFWNQLLGAIIPTSYAVNGDYVSLGTDQVEYAIDQSPVINARLRNADGRPVDDATVDAELSRDGVVQTIVPLGLVDESRGTYRGQADDLEPGRYDVSIRASGFGREALQASTPIWIEDRAADEWARLSLDESNLKAIAKAGGGNYQHESNVDYLLEDLKPISSGTVIESDYALWQSWPWFAVVILLLAAEWLMRKRVGLI